jgi:pimeloyl-ACP methyl ester carboxylesterase
MSSATPFYREAGAGPGVVCIHSNASSSAQWRGLMERLAPRRHVLAPDSYGCGKSPGWPSAHEISLADEVALLQPVFAVAGDPFDLVGHSYGAAIALVAAVSQGHRVRAVAVYEPTLFSLVERRHGSPNGVDGIRFAVQRAAAALDEGDTDSAARHFIDFWMGAGSWEATPGPRKPAISDAMAGVRRWAHALFTEPTPIEAFEALDVPVLYMLGGRSPESAHAVARELVPRLRRVELVEFAGLGHMGPITHPDIVNAEIAKFLGEV